MRSISALPRQGITFPWINLGKPFIFVLSVSMAALAVPAFAQDTGAKASGSWESPTLWTGGAVPNSSNNVYIGSTYPAGAAATATVTLSTDESAGNVNVGYNASTNGTLDLGSSKLTITGTLTVGNFSGFGAITEEGGSFATNALHMYAADSLTMGASDVTSSIDIENAAALTTSAVGNVVSGGSVASGGVLNLGANMSLTFSSGLNVESSGAATTLNLNGHTLTAPLLDLGFFQTSAVTLNRGSGTQGTLNLTKLEMGNGQNLTLIAGDVTSLINVVAGAVLTTAATGNITSGGTVNAATLNLGADLSLGAGTTLDLKGSGATLNLNGHTVTAPLLNLGFNLTSAATLNRGSGTPGTLNLTKLQTGNGENLALIAGDVLGTINAVTGSVLTTAATGNITGGGTVNGATLNLGADMNLGATGALDVKSSGAATALNLNGHNLTAHSLGLGFNLSSSVTFDRGSGTPGILTLTDLQLGHGQNLTLLPGDVISGVPGAIDIDTGATLTTVAATNVTTTVNVVAGTLNLGADMGIMNQTVNEATGSTVNLNGHNLAASYYLLGYAGTGTVTLNRGSGTPGILTLGNLFLGNGQNLTLLAGDTVSSGSDGIGVTAGATLTTVAASNVSNNDISISTGGIVNLGASLNMGSISTLNIQDTGSALHAQGNAITAQKIFVGANGSAAVTVDNLGQVTGSELHMGNSSLLTLHSGDLLNSILDLESGSILTVQQTSSETGLTLNGNVLSDLTIESASMSKLELDFSAPVTLGDWAFRWADPGGSDWVSTLATMIGDGQIVVDAPNGVNVSVVDANGYTYIQVPEPSSLALLGLGLAGAGLLLRRRRVRRAHPDRQEGI